MENLEILHIEIISFSEYRIRIAEHLKQWFLSHTISSIDTIIKGVPKLDENNMGPFVSWVYDRNAPDELTKIGVKAEGCIWIIAQDKALIWLTP